MKFLGIKVGDHDYNFSFSDGKNVRYHKTERQLQIKHHGSMDPTLWIPVLKNWGYSTDDLDAICVTSDEELYRDTHDPSIHYHLIDSNKWFPGISCPVYRLDHHLAHALSIWPVTNKTATVSFVFDGDGDFHRSFSIFKGLDLIHSEKVDDVKSFGALLEETALLLEISGMRLDLAGKAMGLKSFGNINYDYKDFSSIFSLTDINKISDITLWETITQTNFADSKLDYLATMHDFAEVKFPELFNKYASANDIISFTGGVAQNSVLNGKLQQKFPNIIIPPHSNDEGLSLGCIEFLRLTYQQEQFDKNEFPFWQNDPCPESPSKEIINEVAELLASGKIVGWHQGKGEVGPRALGNRSILMDPRITNGQEIINKQVKNRENYRPFGASIIKEYAPDFFNMQYESPYMLHVADVISSNIPAVTHVDGTSRVHTVDNSNIYYYELLEKFNQKTGCPLLLNTSLNNNGKPLTSSENDSIDFFKNSKMDALCFGNKLYKKC
jgi:carbamoyltransferase